MNAHLCKNVCKLPRYAMNQDLGLEELRRMMVSSTPAVSGQTTSHIPKSCDMVWSLLEEFLMKKQMFWYEVLSLVEDLQHAILSLEKLGRWLGALHGPWKIRQSSSIGSLTGDPSSWNFMAVQKSLHAISTTLHYP